MIKKQIILIVLPMILLVACSKDFLEGPEVMNDPNRATTVSADQLFNAIQAKAFFMLEGNLSRVTNIWMQTLAGTDRQMGDLGEYNYTDNETGDEMDDLFTDGGLIDIRELQSMNEEAGNRVYTGIAKCYEALLIGTAASLYGDFPYSEAISEVEQPRLDSQASVYQALQALLDEAIADLASGERAGSISPQNDVNFGGDADLWMAVCYTLKARLYMHWAEVDASNYGLAMAAAQQGIADASGNWRTIHTEELNEEWGYFTFYNQRDSYIRGGAHLIDLLKEREDPRLEIYFDPGVSGEYEGAEPGERNPDVSNLSEAEFLNPAHSQDLVSWEENQLIMAECAYHAGDEAQAADLLNATRRGIEARWGLDDMSLGDAAGLSGAELLAKIIDEKYIALFLNTEIYNDWKRTNLPVLVPFNGGDPLIKIPRRLYYSPDERNANDNIPSTSAQPIRNANDPS
ncbi:SusD/RagB family nutrient-binding outer membrane lipoprotein [bacterium]|nr:SusD/RagB family nutrient-binding outer membrane lipoprotein [bacterium]